MRHSKALSGMNIVSILTGELSMELPKKNIIRVEIDVR